MAIWISIIIISIAGLAKFFNGEGLLLIIIKLIVTILLSFLRSWKPFLDFTWFHRSSASRGAILQSSRMSSRRVLSFFSFVFSYLLRIG